MKTKQISLESCRLSHTQRKPMEEKTYALIHQIDQLHSNYVYMRRNLQ